MFTEASAVLPDGRISPDDLGIWKDEHIEALCADHEIHPRPGRGPGNAARPRGTKRKHRLSPSKGAGSIADRRGRMGNDSAQCRYRLAR